MTNGDDNGECFFHTTINLMVSYIQRQQLEMMMETATTTDTMMGDYIGDNNNNNNTGRERQ